MRIWKTNKNCEECNSRILLCSYTETEVKLMCTHCKKVKIIPFPKGFELCKKCDGFGYYIIKTDTFYQTCERCSGMGFISWVDKLKGVQNAVR